MSNVDPEELVTAIQDAGYEPRSYSGRAMYGKQCVAVTLDSDADLWALAWEFGARDIEPGPPKTDSLGLNVIAYWPHIEWPSDA